MKTPSQGFTLIELLVVISIIGLLSGLVLVSVQGSRIKAQDSRRLSDMRQMVTAITMYYDRFESFPANHTDSCCGEWDQGPCLADGNDTFVDDLKTSGVMGSVPVDPAGKPKGSEDQSCYGYFYYVYPAGFAGCDAARGKFFVLGVRNLEAIDGPYPQSPGFSCPDKDWQDDFEWVTGGFEKDF